MLPEAKSYLVTGGLTSGPAAYATIGAFLAGVLGIQLISRVMHHYIPSHVVDCDHPRQGGNEHDGRLEDDGQHHSHGHAHPNDHTRRHRAVADENTSLLPPKSPEMEFLINGRPRSFSQGSYKNFSDPPVPSPSSRRPSLHDRVTTRIGGFLSGAKASCEATNKCSGYGEPCLSGCLRPSSRSPTSSLSRRKTAHQPSHPPLSRTATAPSSHKPHQEPLGDLTEETNGLCKPTHTDPQLDTIWDRRDHSPGDHPRSSLESSVLDVESNRQPENPLASHMELGNEHPDHHHHVPSNAFLSIGLQTSIAIALHKLPEGFITFATNHANPKLGFSVFMALFIHNITEGFAMALPLYLALKSRPKAMFWSSLLGGVSQPLGAGIAALWFKIAGSRGMAPGELVYGCMFAITSGVMASVALQLFQESMTMTHHRNLCTLFAFIGMGVLGFSFALTAS